MANYVLTGPNGEEYDVDAPEGTANSDIENYFRSQTGKTGRVTSDPTSQLAGLQDQYDTFRQNQTGLNSNIVSNIEGNLNNPAVNLNPTKNTEYPGYGRRAADLATGVSSGVFKTAGALAGLGTYVRGVSNIADPVAEYLYDQGDKIDERLLSGYQLNKKRELQADLQTAVQNMPPYPENASTSEKIKYVSDFVINQGGAAGSFLLENPGQIGNFIAETLPFIVAGGGVGRGVSGGLNLLDNAISVGSKAKTITSKVAQGATTAAGPIGEGFIAAGDVGAGTVIEQREQGNYDYDPNRLYGLLTAPTTALIGRAGSKLSRTTDIDTLATGLGGDAVNLVQRGLGKRVAVGAATEGVEEFLQSGSETAYGNLATDNPVYEGVGGAAVIGAATGSALGATVNLRAPATNSQTDLDAENALLEAQQEQEQQEQEQAQVQEQVEAENIVAGETADLVNDVREAAAQTFTPYKQFVKERVAAIDAQNKLDIEDPNTEIGAAFKVHLKDYRANATVADRAASYDKTGKQAIKTKFLNGAKKGASNPEEDGAAYEQALDEYAKNLNENPTVAEVEPVDNTPTAAELMETMPVRSRSTAIAKAEAVLGENWINNDDYEGLAAIVNAKSFTGGTKKFNAALEAIVNPVAEPVNASTEVEEATTSLLATPVTQMSVKFSKNEQKIADVLEQASRDDTLDTLFEPDGTPIHTEIRNQAGLNSRQASRTSIDRIMAKIAKSQGLTADKVKERLGETKYRDAQGNPRVDPKDEAFDINAPTTVAPAVFSEVGVSGTVGSVGQGNFDGVSDAEQEFTESRSQEPDAYENKRQELADKSRRTDNQKMLEANLPEAIQAWKDGVSDGGPAINQLSNADGIEWVLSVVERKEGRITDDQLADDLREIEKRYDASNAGVTMEDTDETAAQDTEDQATSNDDPRPDTGPAESAESGDQAEPSGNENTGTGKESVEEKPYRFTAEDVLAEYAKRGSKDTTLEQAQNVANVRNGMLARRGKQQSKNKENDPEDDEDYRPVNKKPTAKFSVEETEAQANGTTANNLKDAIKWFIGKDANWRTTVVNNPDDLIGLVLSKQLNIDGLTLSGILDKANAQGVVVTDRDGVARAFMFADNIETGNERAAIAHEVGGHIGMDNVLSADQLNKAATKIQDWANSKTTSLEKKIAERALSRVGSAQNQDAASDANSETIAYFLEEAVKAGVLPTSDAKSDLVSFVRQLWSDFKRALRKLRPANDAALSAQDLVNMARGAARLQLVTNFHGASTSFRKVNSDFIGLGNNAIGVGFYVSEDQETGATYMVQRMDERLADEGSLQRVDTTIAETEFLDWKQPLSKQPNVLAQVRKIPRSILADLNEEVGSNPLENLTGRQLYLALTSLQLREFTLETLIDDAAYDKANALSRNTTTAMAITSAYLDGLGVKGIKVEIAPNNSQPSPVFNKVIFNADNALVVGREDAANVDTTGTSGLIQFSVPETETQQQTSWVRKNFGNGAAELLTNLQTLAQKPLDATKNLDRLVRENEQKMPSLRKMFNFMLDAEATRNEVLSMVEGVINPSRPFSMERRELINDFIGASTFFQKWGYDPLWTDRKTGKAISVTVDPTIKTKYDRLTAEEQQVVRDVFSHGRNLQIMMQEIAENLGVSKFFKFDSKLQGPYSPLKRFGNYVAELKSQALLDANAALSDKPTTAERKKIEELKSNGDHYVIRFFKSQGEADTFVQANSGAYAYAEAAEKSVSFDEARTGGAQAYEKILGAVNANLAGLDQASKDAMAKMVRDMYFQTLDDRSARLSGTKRLNRAGYDKDMLRSFAEHGMAQANLIAQMKHGADISSALVAARKEASANARQLLPVYNKMALKFQRIMTPRTGMFATIETNVMKFNSFYMLTSSLGYFLQNMTQPYFAVANIAEISGYSKQPAVWGKLFSGYSVAKKIINTGFLNQIVNVGTMGLLGGNSTVELNIDKAPPELRPMLKDLQLRGLLDVGITEDLRHVNMSPNVAIRAYDEMTHRLYQSARYVEANNRIASAVAAFKMAQQNPQKMKRLKMTPAEFAVRIVQDTQGNFSQLDAPAAFDVLPKAPLQFRKYQFQMAWLHLDAVKQSLKGATPEIKMAGFRKFSLMMGYTGVFGGLVSVPMANVATALLQAAIAAASGDDEENPPKSLERWIREKVEDERTATLLTRGVPAALGWDFSQKLDQSDLFMPYNSKYVQIDPSRDGSLLFAAQLALGPTGTMVGNIGNFADFVNRENYYRAAEYALPKGMRSYLETLRFSDTGYTTRAGTTITDPTSFDAMDFLTNSVGLPSTDINQIKWKRGQQIEITQWFSKETTRIKRGYLAAYDSRDRNAMAEYREEFRELQKGKDRVRPFFNNSRSVLKRSQMVELIRAPRNRAREQRRLDKITGR